MKTKMQRNREFLANALNARVAEYTDAIDRLRDIAEGDTATDPEETCRQAWKLREAVELVRCLRRLLLSSATDDDIYRAFGAPGDFGYETLIGDSLARFYGVLR